MVKTFDHVDELRDARFHESKKRDHFDTRSEIQQDYGRLVHSPPFRRLQGKSQVFGAGSGDYYRTRLTHTLEVAQISWQIAQRLAEDHFVKELPDNPGLKINPLVVECAALAHDLGHPPFGHRGEYELDGFLKKSNEEKYQNQAKSLRYEGNAQNFRILMNLEERYGGFSGLNLTHSVLLGINKYPYSIEENEEKGLYDTEWEKIREIREKWGIPKGKPTLEAQLMDISDDIAYSTHDIEDGMKAEKIRLNRHFLIETDWLQEALNEQVNKVKSKNEDLWTDVSIKDEIIIVMDEYLKTWEEIKRELTDDSIARQELKAHYLNLFASSVGVIKDGDWYKISLVDRENREIENKALWRKMIILKKLAWVTLVEDLRVQRLQKRGEIILKGLWKAFSDEEKGSKIIPRQWMKLYEKSKQKDINLPWERFIADYISGMTDSYAEKIYGELYGSRAGNIYGD